MLNKTLFQMEFKSNYKLLLLFMGILTLYITIISTMYDPELGSALKEFEKLMPEMMSIVGMSGDTSTLVNFMSVYLYGLILIAFPLIFYVLSSLKLIAKKVDNGSMAYLLTCGNTRTTVWFTQLCVLLFQVALLLIYCVCIELLSAQIMFPNELDLSSFLRLNSGLFALHFSLSSFVFLCSCAFNEYRNAALLGAGIPILCLLIQMLSNMGGKLENLKYCTIMTLFDTEGLIEGTSNAWYLLFILLIISILCIVISKVIFKRKNMSL